MSGSLQGLAISGSYTEVSSNPSAIGVFYGYFNITVSGTFVGTLTLQRSFDRGQNWHNVSRDLSGTNMTFSLPTSLLAYEPENGVF